MSVPRTQLVSGESTRSTLKRLLHTAVNVQRRFTVGQIADESGVEIETIRSYMKNGGNKEPSLSRALSIAVVLGDPAVNAVLALIGYSGAPLEEPGAASPMQIVADTTAQIAIIARAAVDNRIDHTEEPETTEAADIIIATVLPLSSHREQQ